MASTLVQFRADSAAKDTAIGICEKLGLDLQSYLRMCISRLIYENGIPFTMNVNSMSMKEGGTAKTTAEIVQNNNQSKKDSNLLKMFVNILRKSHFSCVKVISAILNL